MVSPPPSPALQRKDKGDKKGKKKDEGKGAKKEKDEKTKGPKMLKVWGCWWGQRPPLLAP